MMGVFFLQLMGLGAIGAGYVAWPLWSQRRYQAGMWLLCGLVMMSMGAYVCWGQSASFSRLLYLQSHQETIRAQVSYMRQHPEALLTAMRHYLATHKTDAKGWAILGGLCLRSEQNQSAFVAFNHACRLQPHHQDYCAQAQYARFLYQGYLTPQQRHHVQTLLAAQPHHAVLLSLMGMDAWKNADYAAAVQYWRRWLSALPAGDPQAKTVQTWIKAASKKKTKASFHSP